MKHVEITQKHVEALVDRNIILIFTLSGTFKAQFYGKIVGRLRTRFKQYIFVPNTPFVSFYFSVGDVEKIELDDGVFIVKLGVNPGPATEKKRGKKKSKKVRSRKKANRAKKTKFPTVAVEPEISVIDLSNTIVVSAQASSEVEITPVASKA